MRRFGQMLVVLFLLGLLSGCGAIPKGEDVDADQPPAPQSDREEDATGQGIDPLGSSSSTLDDPSWRSDAGLYGGYDINVEPEHRVRFALNSALITEEAAQVLGHNAAWIRAHLNTGIITIEGHCDERGTREFNLALGQQRSDAVVQYLVSQGVDRTRLRSVSYGKERPLVWGHDESAWRENRRAEIVFP